MSIKQFLDSISNTRKDWREDWKESSIDNWKRDWKVPTPTGPIVPVGSSVNLTLPVLTSTLAAVGIPVFVTQGIWSNQVELESLGLSGISYNWLANGVVIPDALPYEQYYIPTSDVIGSTITCNVVFSIYNLIDSSTIDTSVIATGSVGPIAIRPIQIAPINLKLPILSQTAQAINGGAIVSNVDSYWTGDQPITFEYLWYVDNVLLLGETNTSVNLNNVTYIGKTLKSEIVATNSAGSTTIVVGSRTITL